LKFHKEYAMARRIIGSFAVALVLAHAPRADAAEEQGQTAEVKAAFKMFAAAIKKDDYASAAKLIAVPADKI